MAAAATRRAKGLSRKALAELQAARRRDAARVHLSDCPHLAGHFVDVRPGVVARCSCWKAYQAALDQPMAAPLPLRGES